jgi:hypothetical protein
MTTQKVTDAQLIESQQAFLRKTPVKIASPKAVYGVETPSHERSLDLTKTLESYSKASVGRNSTEKQASTSNRQLSFDTISVPTTSGKSQFSTRCDVVYKKILRDFRRSFIQDFNDSTKYMKNKRYRSQDYYIQCVSDYLLNKVECRYNISLSEFGLADQLEEATLALGSFLYPKEMKKTKFGLTTMFQGDSKAWEECVGQFHGALYNFSMEKVSQALDNKYLALFLRLFINDIHSRDKV